MVELNIKLPEKFLEPEIRCDYEISRKMKEVWAVEIDLLVKLLEVCKKYDIKIFLDSGSLLGAIRHKGMIPWDDDIDVVVLRDDYEKLCNIAQKEFSEPYFFQTEYTDKGSLRGHAQLRNSQTTGILASEKELNLKFNQGIFIDIFPLDNILNRDNARNNQVNKIIFYKKMFYKFANVSIRYRDFGSNLVKRTLKRIMHKFFYSYLKKKALEYYFLFENECKSGNKEDSEEIFKAFFCDTSFKILKKSWLSNQIFVDFEFIKVPISPNYDEILRVYYGDYNVFVKGGAAHGKVFFDTDNSYMKYIENKK